MTTKQPILITAHDKDANPTNLMLDPTPVAQGGEGTIFKTTDNQYIIKLYHPTNQRSLEGILEILRAAPDPSNKEARYLAWPKYLLIGENQRIAGVVVPNAGYGGDWVEQMIWYTNYKVHSQINPAHKGNYRGFIQMLRTMCSGLRYLNQTGYGHADLSGRNILCNPERGFAVVIDLDGLVVPGHLAGDVLGTPGFLAPELVDSGILRLRNPPVLPSAATDRHALAVLIYQVLLWHHPLLGGSRPPLNDDPNLDDLLQTSSKFALYVHHPTNTSNRKQGHFIHPHLLGPEMEGLFQKAFIDGLLDAQQRPRPWEWERALQNLEADLVACQNPNCVWRYFPSLGGGADVCPLCDTKAKKETIGELSVALARPQQPGFYAHSSIVKLHRKNVLRRQDLFGKNAGKQEVLDLVYEQKRWRLRMKDNAVRVMVFNPTTGRSITAISQDGTDIEPQMVVRLEVPGEVNCVIRLSNP